MLLEAPCPPPELVGGMSGIENETPEIALGTPKSSPNPKNAQLFRRPKMTIFSEASQRGFFSILDT